MYSIMILFIVLITSSSKSNDVKKTENNKNIVVGPEQKADEYAIFHNTLGIFGRTYYRIKYFGGFLLMDIASKILNFELKKIESENKSRPIENLPTYCTAKSNSERRDLAKIQIVPNSEDEIFIAKLKEINRSLRYASCSHCAEFKPPLDNYCREFIPTFLMLNIKTITVLENYSENPDTHYSVENKKTDRNIYAKYLTNETYGKTDSENENPCIK